MKVLGLFVAGFLSLSAKAEVYQCNFTEPFIIVTVDTVKKVATWDIPGETIDAKDVELTSLISWQNSIEAKIIVKGVEHKLKVDFSKKGSDGMSDLIYPFEGVFKNYFSNSAGEIRDFYGACFTETNKPVCPPNSGC